MGNKRVPLLHIAAKAGGLLFISIKKSGLFLQALNPMRRMGCGSSFTICLLRRRLPAFTTSSWVMVRNRKVLSGMESCDMIRWAMHLMIPCSIRLCSQRPLPKYLPFPSVRPHCNRQSRTGEGNVPASRDWYGASAAFCPRSRPG